MVAIGVRAAKAQFFDRYVKDRVGAMHRKALSKFGRNVRKDARALMKTARKRKRKTKNTMAIRRRGQLIQVSSVPSPPGTAPRSVRGHLKRFLFFLYEPRSKNVVIGPILLPRARNAGNAPVPAVHEQKRRSEGIVHKRSRRKRKRYTVRYPRRPYMIPAFEKNKNSMPGLYRDSLTP